MKGIKCGECMKEIEEERIVFDKDGKIIRYPAFCKKCSFKIKKKW